MKNCKQIAILILSSLIVACSGNSGGSSTTSTNTWQSVGSTLPWYNVSFNALAISNTGTVYSGGTADVNNGLVVGNTAESGAWQMIGTAYIPQSSVTHTQNPAIIQVNALTISTTNIVYAVASYVHQFSLIYTNTGTNGAWESISASYTPDAYLNSVINTIALDHNQVVYVGTAGYNTNTNVYFGDVYNNTGTGGIWQLIGGGPMPDGGVTNSLVLSNSGIVYVGSGGYDVNDPNTYFGDVYSNTGTGGIWQQLGGGHLPDGGVTNSIALAKDDVTIYAGSSVGHVYSSKANSNWQAIGGGLMPDNSTINSIAVADSGAIYAATSNGNVYATTVTSTWQLIGGGSMPDGWFINAIALYKNKVYATTQNGNTYVTNAAL